MTKKLLILVVLLLVGLSAIQSHAENYAIQFDGVDDYIEVPHHSSFNWNQQATIECWVRIFNSNSGVIFNKWRSGYEDKQLILDSRRKVTFHLHGLEPPGINRWSRTVLNVDQWYHITGTARGDSLFIYINGYLDTSWAASGSYIGNSGNPAIIGAVYYRPGSDTPINGEIDEFRIWNIYKTPEDIRSMMFQEASGNEQGLVTVWHFNEGQGQIAYDSSPNHNNGRLGSTTGEDPRDPQWVYSTSPINTGTIAGIVTETDGTTPIDEVLVEVLQGGIVKGSDNTNGSGQYSIPNLSPGTYDVRASKFGYETQTQTGVIVQANQTTTVNFDLMPLPTGMVTGFVYDGSTGSPLGGVVVEFWQGGQVRYSTITEPSLGKYDLWSVFAGTYNVCHSKEGYHTLCVEKTVQAGEWNMFQPVPLFPEDYVSSQPLKTALDELADATHDYMLCNVTLASEFYGSALAYLYDPVHEELLNFTYSLWQKVDIIAIKKFLMEKGFSKTQALTLALKLSFEIAEMIKSLELSALVDHITEGTYPNEAELRNRKLPDTDLTIQQAIYAVIPPSIPDYVRNDYPQQDVVDQIHDLIEVLNKAKACSFANLEGKEETSYWWYIPGYCELPQRPNCLPIGSDVTIAQYYNYHLTRLINAEKLNANINYTCYVGQMGMLGAKGVMALSGVGASAAAIGEAAYVVGDFACAALEIVGKCVELHEETKLATAITQYAANWPHACKAAYTLFNAVSNDISESINNDFGQCSRVMHMANPDVPTSVCADLILEYGEGSASVTVDNPDPQKEGKAQVVFEVYVTKKINDNYVRWLFDSFGGETYTLGAGSSQTIQIPFRVSVTSLWGFGWTKYEGMIRILTPSGEQQSSYFPFICAYPPLCHIFNAADQTHEVVSGWIETGQREAQEFITGAGTVATQFSLNWPGSDLDLHVYDQFGNHVGWNDTTGQVELEIPGAFYSGHLTRPEVIYVPSGPSLTYSVQVAGVSVADSEYFAVSAYEVGEHPAMLSPIGTSYDLAGFRGDSVSFQIGLAEVGGQQAVTGISVVAHGLSDSLGHIIDSSNVIIQATPSVLEPDSAVFLSSFIVVPDSAIFGIYSGVIDVSSSADSFKLSVILEVRFVSGDANGDGVINSADIVYLINYQFIGGPPPVPLEAGDANCDGMVNSADIVYLINYQFIGGPPPGC